MTTKELKQFLIDGQDIMFDNEKFCAETQSDDFKVAQCTFTSAGRISLLDGFQIRFNGALFVFKTFVAFEKKLIKLKQQFSLELSEL